MKILPCRGSCGDRIAKVGPRREPYYAQTFPGSGGRPLKFVCSGCRTSQALTAIEFNMLPVATREQLEAAGILDHVSKDLTLGGEVPIEQARDLFMGGLTPVELAPLVRVEEDAVLAAGGVSEDAIDVAARAGQAPRDEDQ